MRRSEHLSCCCLTCSMQLGQKRWWPHGTRASRVTRGATNYITQTSFCCGSSAVCASATSSPASVVSSSSSSESQLVSCTRAPCELQRCSLQHAGTVCGYRRCCHNDWCMFLYLSAPTVALTSWNANSVWLTGRSGNASKQSTTTCVLSSFASDPLSSCA